MQLCNIKNACRVSTLLAGLLLLTACGGSSSSDTSPPADTDAEWNATKVVRPDWQ